MDKTRFWAERLYVNSKISSHIYYAERDIPEVIGIGENEEDPFLTDPYLEENLRKMYEEKRAPVLTIEDGWVAYMAFSDAENNFYIGGPVSLATDKEEKSGLYHYRRRHQLSQRKLNIPRMSIMKLAGILSMSLFSLCGLEISEAELMELSRIETGKKSEIEGELVNYKFDSSENERKHVTYEYEKKYYDAIKRGDSDYFKGPMYDKLHLYDEIGKLAEGGLKQAEYMVAAGLALISRAAMEGGVSPTEAYAVSDVFYQRLEKCKTQKEMYQLSSEIQRTYVKMVQERKKEKKNSNYVEQCKDYLTQNFHKRITVEELAKQIGVNRTYLSGKFSEQVGMSISQYSILIRIRAAENMLKYSEASISYIADYLCFSSQSHFGREFKKKNGISPSEYRKQNKNIHFLSKQT